MIETSYQTFTKNVSKDLNQYIKKSGGDITLEYRDLITGETFQINSTKSHAAASTIKLPLAMYVIELADAKKIDLNQKLTYRSSHYYEGSGVIQKDKVGTKYTMNDLIKKAMMYSDNIAFIMLKEKVGQGNFIKYMKKLGATYAYPNGQNKTSSHDLAIYAQYLYKYAQNSTHGKELVNYLQHTIYNETIPKGIKGVKTAHKVGMIPMNQVSNDVGVIYDKSPFVLAVMTNHMPYEKSKKVIAGIASTIYKHHQEKNDLEFFTTKSDVPVYQSTNEKERIGTLKKSEAFKVTGNNGAWLGIQFGKTEGYIQKKFVTSYSKAPITGFNNGNSQSNQVVKMKIDTPVLTTASSQGNSIAMINKDVQFPVLTLINDYYKVSLGNRTGYIQAKNVDLQNTEAAAKEETSYYSHPIGKFDSLLKGMMFDKVMANLFKFDTPPVYAAEINRPENKNPIDVAEKTVYAVKATTTVPIRITFAGDLMMDWSVKTTINKKGVDYPFQQVKKEVSKSDFAVVNLETAVTTKTNKYPKEYNFKSNPSALQGVKNAGFDMVSLANNHSMDFRQEGFIDTMNALKKYQLPYIGAGFNSKEAYTAKTYTIKGKKVTFLGFSKVLPDKNWVAQSNRAGIADGYNLSLITSTIKKSKVNSDYLFVYMHWGVERSKRPEAFQRTWAKKMIDAGADAVIGSHSHVLQGFEYYKGKPIAYSLGNFLFPNYVTGDKAQTGLLHIDINQNKLTMNFVPYKIYKDQIIAQSNTTKQKVWKNLQSISYGVTIKNEKITIK